MLAVSLLLLAVYVCRLFSEVVAVKCWVYHRAESRGHRKGAPCHPSRRGARGQDRQQRPVIEHDVTPNPGCRRNAALQGFIFSLARAWLAMENDSTCRPVGHGTSVASHDPVANMAMDHDKLNQLKRECSFTLLHLLACSTDPMWDRRRWCLERMAFGFVTSFCWRRVVMEH